MPEQYTRQNLVAVTGWDISTSTGCAETKLPKYRKYRTSVHKFGYNQLGIQSVICSCSNTRNFRGRQEAGKRLICRAENTCSRRNVSYFVTHADEHVE